jgi:hypothetical protein
MKSSRFTPPAESQPSIIRRSRLILPPLPTCSESWILGISSRLLPMLLAKEQRVTSRPFFRSFGVAIQGGLAGQLSHHCAPNNVQLPQGIICVKCPSAATLGKSSTVRKSCQFATQDATQVSIWNEWLFITHCFIKKSRISSVGRAHHS